MKLHDVVELLVDVPEEGLCAGAIGAIVDEYADSDACEVEFIDSETRTMAILAMRRHCLRLKD
ncbi:DUF4926 domain-containing protein [Actinosynnema sp. NPDC023587]|uniref:DUF4926 domain-containing protein n=1 Tax=Actinosynnema sp. NPDC023587 TaxID=3154695 RepID=UPI0033F15A6B